MSISFKCKKTCAKNLIGYNAFTLQIEIFCNVLKRLIYLLSKLSVFGYLFFIAPGRPLFSVIPISGK